MSKIAIKIFLLSVVVVGAYVSGLTIMNAQNNFWGDSTGPYHSTLNPGGFGNPVSDNVLFIPWLQTDPTKPPVVRPSVSNLNQFKSDGITGINEILKTKTLNF